MAKTVSKVLGVVYVVVGVAGLILGDDADRNHNLLHFLTGLLALYFGFAASQSGAKRFCLASGSAYLAFGALGFVLGNAAMGRELHVGLLSVSMGDHVHHAVLGTIMLAGGILTTSEHAPDRTPTIRHAHGAAGPDE